MVKTDTPRSEKWTAGVLIASTVLAAAWLLASRASRRAWEPFERTPQDFVGFEPSMPGYDVRRIAVPQDPQEVNLFALDLAPTSMSRHAVGDGAPGAVNPGLRGPGGPIRVRLVHGYNMVDCMRIKGYRVEPITAASNASGPGGGESGQVWRLTSSQGEVSIWITGILRAGDMGETGIDVRSIAFPRVGIPDDVSWLPQGMRWSSLRHPIQNARIFLRARWNASRCDWLTFLRLRRPAWASDELYTYVVSWQGASVEAGQESRVVAEITDAYRRACRQLKTWWAAKH